MNRSSDQITRIEVHLSDDNSTVKFGMTDKHCLLEVRPTSRHSITSTLRCKRLCSQLQPRKKMVNLLETELGKRGKR